MHLRDWRIALGYSVEEPAAVSGLSCELSIRMCTLIESTQSGKTSRSPLIVPLLSRSAKASAKPRKAIERGTIPVRKEIVEVEIMNTPAILIAYRCITWKEYTSYSGGPRSPQAPTNQIGFRVHL